MAKKGRVVTFDKDGSADPELKGIFDELRDLVGQDFTDKEAADMALRLGGFLKATEPKLKN